MENRQECMETFSICCPATLEPVAEYPLMSPQEVDNAVKAARMAFSHWSKSAIETRRRILRKAAGILAENAEKYAREIAEENGKTTMDAMLADIFSTAHLLDHYARKLASYLAPVRGEGTIFLPGRKTYYVLEPKGVIGVISPWNYPFTLSAGPAITAVAAGNAVVLKPSSQTTRSGLIVKEIFDLAGLPGGVIQVVTGSGSVTGEALANHPDLDMIFFTGSTQVGYDINVKAAQRLIPVIMELGGKDVAIVTKNADLDRAVSGITWACFTNCGQTCIGTELILVDRAVYEPFTAKLVQAVNGLRLGKACGEIGAMTMESQYRIVEQQLDDAVAKGAKVLAGGKPAIRHKGRFFAPTILADTTPDMKVRHEETFGPLKCILPFDTIEEALEIANSSEYGLSGAVYTQNQEEGREIARKLKTGSVNINDALITYMLPSLPFGGVKKSGLGRYHGKEGLQAFSDVKSVTEYWWGLKREVFWYPIPSYIETAFPHFMQMMYGDGLGKRIKGANSAAFVMLRSFFQKA